jgi:hypothetical protein
VVGVRLDAAPEDLLLLFGRAVLKLEGVVVAPGVTEVWV